MAPPVALVNMPWSSVRHPSIALGILKRSLRRRKIASDVLYLNIGLANRMNVSIYEVISNILLVADWLFSVHLYGEHGSGELQNSYADIIRNNEDIRGLLNKPQIDFDQIVKEILPDFLESCMEDVQWGDYQIVGFTSVFYQHMASLLLAKRIKERFPHIKIVFGGANVEGPMGHETLRRFDWVDYVVDGEAEQSFPALVEHILNNQPAEKVSGVSFRNGSEIFIQKQRPPMISMNRVPIPDYTDFFEQLDAVNLREKVNPVLLFESARGCWWGEKAHCTFCGLNGQSMAFRSKSPRRILQEILAHSAKYGVLQLEAVDNILDMQRFKDLLPELATKRLDLRLFYEVKSSLTEDQLDVLCNAGVRSIQPGIESLSTDVLKLMRKGVTAGQNIQLLKWCTERKMSVSWNILYGFPGETPAFYDQMLHNIYSISHLLPPQVLQRITVQRFSPYHFDSDRFHIRDVTPFVFYRHIYPADIDLNELAYHFSYSFEGDCSAACIQPIASAVNGWKRLHAEGKILFQSRKGHRFLELLDSRPECFDGEIKLRKTKLTGLSSDLYEFCNSCKSVTDVYRYAATKNGTPEQVNELLDGFVAQKQMYREGDRYLSLALRRQPLNS